MGVDCEVYSLNVANFYLLDGLYTLKSLYFRTTMGSHDNFCLVENNLLSSNELFLCACFYDSQAGEDLVSLSGQ